MNKQVKIFLTGGGAKGSFHIGFFKALEEFKIKPNLVCGSSVGALVSAASTYLNFYDMLECWKDITFDNVLGIDSSKIENLLGHQKTLAIYKETLKLIMEKKHLISIEGVRKLLYTYLNSEQILSSPIDFGVTTTEFPSFKHLMFLKKDMIVNPLEYIIASMYMLVFKNEKIINGKHYIDIAGHRRIPLEMLGNDLNSIHIVVNIESTKDNKIKQALLRSQLPQENTIIINIPYDMSMFDFSRNMTQKLFQEGYSTSMKVLSKSLNKNIYLS